MEKVVERGNLKKALERVERNKGAAGIDGMTTAQLRPFLKQDWKRIKQELLNGTYQPSPVRRVEIPKPDGGLRQLGIPTTLDRFIQQAVQQVLTGIFDPTFESYSYGFRLNRSAHQAVKAARSHISEGRRYVVDIDLSKFFDRVHHDKLMMRLASTISDKRILSLIRRYLKSGVMMNGVCVSAEMGTPQGGPLSPLLSNIVLDELDKELDKRGLKYVRYADDCNIYVKSKRAGDRVFKGIRTFIEKKLKLQINEDKSAVDRPWKRKFLGFTFSSSSETQIWLAPQTKERLKGKIRSLTKGHVSMPIEDRIKKLNEYLIGWCGYFALAQMKKLLEEIEGWMRRRLRMCLLKQWKRCSTKLKRLVAEGISKSWAQGIAFSRKKYWRLANTYQMNTAFGTSYWQKLGLISILNRYCEIR
jgi:group II intron reverse transcriptase/maturase